MENYIPISYINDFIFCPRSIYYHQLYNSFEQKTYQSKVQIDGKNAHESIDTKMYSDKKNILLSTEIVSEKYGIYGKLDMYNIDTGTLTERKNKIQTIYDGYIFQLYAQYFCLLESGYFPEKIQLYDYSKNKVHAVLLPEQNINMFEKFEHTLYLIKSYSLLDKGVKPNIEKCRNCIYNELCDESLC
jgi:CRISPR-associated exonuclease Cas4